VVVIAAGCWSGEVGKLAGVDIPIFPRRRSKFITAPFPGDRIPPETPFIIDHHVGLSTRREGAGVMIGFGRKDEASSFDTRPDWELAPLVAERSVWRMPALAGAPIMCAWAGLYEMTPDQMGIISKVPGMAGLHVVAGSAATASCTGRSPASSWTSSWPTGERIPWTSRRSTSSGSSAGTRRSR
jgi:glycine/D-amino acid oxidase-like deaminating enzyme